MAQGGKREGAGRKKGSKASHTLLAEQMRAKLIQRVDKEFTPLVDAQVDLAKGIVVERTVIVNGKTIKRYYVKEPDNSALEDLLNRAMGRPKETIEIDDKILKIE